MWHKLMSNSNVNVRVFFSITLLSSEFFLRNSEPVPAHNMKDGMYVNMGNTFFILFLVP
jgi:hypothetical protein